jgi:hypothetical protein
MYSEPEHVGDMLLMKIDVHHRQSNMVYPLKMGMARHAPCMMKSG